MSALLIRNIRLPDGGATEILIEAGRITGMGPPVAAPADATVIDGDGALVLPGLIEGHTHLDKTTWGGPWYRNEVGPTRMDRIQNERAWRISSGHDPAARSLALAQAFLANGTTRLRTHADIDPDIALRHVHATMQTRDAVAPFMQMQIVAFPQSGILCQPGMADWMDAALADGADVVGGIDPCAIDCDPVRHLDTVFALATRHGKPIDIHLHEPGEMGTFSLGLILERTAALGMQGKVVVSHAFCLGTLADRDRDALLARMAVLDVRIATTAPAYSPVPSLQICRAAGVTVFGGNDGIRDSWTPYARPDMLDRAMHIGLRNALRRDDELAWAFECVTSAAATGCGFADYGISPGCRADLVAVHAETIAEAVVTAPRRALVVAAGQTVARNGVPVETDHQALRTTTGMRE
ncbi:MAG: amidohydrolase family protein [Acetobacteraceae bacterium]|nr:amidohydrolase family protein [Acetobacteraceae bacterium]